jgi:hypothetical protein
MTELPLVVIDVQRGGPSTGLPTKTEQADLLQAMFGRNGESPVPIVAPQSPGDCFNTAVEAIRIAVTYRTPVMLLSDGMLANGSEPWQIPDIDDLPTIDPAFATSPNHEGLDKAGNSTEDFWPYLRDEQTLARPWAIPGTAGLEHRIGGLEKSDGHGNISYDPGNHDYMVRIRQAKVDRIAESLPPLEVGLDVRPDRRGLPPRPQGRHGRRAGPPAPPQPVPKGPWRDPQAVRRGDDPRDEPRPALDAGPGEVPRRRRGLQPRSRPALEGGRARRGNH